VVVLQTLVAVDILCVNFPAGVRRTAGFIFAPWLRNGGGTSKVWMQLRFGRANCCCCGGSWIWSGEFCSWSEKFWSGSDCG
jgi:hypothetical protein